MHSEETMSKNQISKENMFLSVSTATLQVVQMTFLRQSNMYNVKKWKNYKMLDLSICWVWVLFLDEYIDLFAFNFALFAAIDKNNIKVSMRLPIFISV